MDHILYGQNGRYKNMRHFATGPRRTRERNHILEPLRVAHLDLSRKRFKLSSKWVAL